MNNQKEQTMNKAESVFWWLVVVAGLYLVFGGNMSSQKQAEAQIAQAKPASAVQAAPAAGCGMNNGGSCGCGGGAINNPPGI